MEPNVEEEEPDKKALLLKEALSLPVLGEWALPLSDNVFDQLYFETTMESLSSDGELTEIAKNQLKRRIQEIKKEGVENMEVSQLSPSSSAGLSCPATPLYSPPPTPVSSQLSVSSWPGHHNFTVKLPSSEKPRSPYYSEKLGKLFINQKKNAGLEVHYESGDDLYLRATLVFTSPDHHQTPVKVCYGHSHTMDGHLMNALAPFVVRVSCPDAEVEYVQHTNGHHCALLKVPEDISHKDHLFLAVQFTDLGSCVGGINRRDTALILSLEQGRDGKHQVGRFALPVRICTCPRRDRETEERNLENLKLMKIKKLTHKPFEDQNIFWVPAIGKSCYEALASVGKVLEKQKPNGDLPAWEALLASKNKS